MNGLFAILSSPVPMRDGTFAVLIGSANGVEVKTFDDTSSAARYYRTMVSCLRMAVDQPLDVVLIDDETEYGPLRQKFDEAYRRRIAPRPPSVPLPSLPDFSLRRLFTRVAGLLG